MEEDQVRVCFPFAGHVVGGSHISSLKLIKMLKSSRFQPYVVVHEPDGPLATLFREEGIDFEKAPTTAPAQRAGAAEHIGHHCRHTLRLRDWLKQNQVDIVHTNDGSMHAAWALATKLAGKKLVWHHRNTAKARGLRYMAPWVADRVISVSHFASAPPGLISTAHKNTVIYSPFEVDTDSLDRKACRAEFAEAHGIDERRFILGFFANLVERKRPLVFVEAMKALAELEPDLSFVGLMFGKSLQGHQAEVERRIEALDLGDRVRLMGFIYPPEPAMAACDLILFPSVEEPFSRILIESMLIGTPIIASRSGGNIEAIHEGKTGLLVDPDDPPRLAQAAHDLLRDDTKRLVIGRTANTEARDKFGTEKHARAVMDVYESLIA